MNGSLLNAMVVQEDEKAAEKAEQEQEESLGDYLKALEQRIQKTQNDFYKKLDEFGDDQEALMKFANENAPDFSDEWGKLMEMVEANAEDKAAPKALNLISQYDFGGENGQKAQKMLISNYIDSQEAMQALSALAYEPSAENEALFKEIIEKNENPKTVASVRFTYAEYLLGAEDYKGYAADEEARSYMDEETIEYLTQDRKKIVYRRS